MSKNNPRLHHNPSDIELVRETDPQDFVEWTIEKMGGRNNLPKDFIKRIENYNPEDELAPLLSIKIPGDSLWLCRSTKIGPFYGNEGICLVRGGVPILYYRTVDY